MVVVDAATWKKIEGRKKYAHMVATTYDELHEFALKIGVKHHFFHKTADLPHYDITEEQAQLAIENGATLVNTRDLIRLAREALRNYID